MTPTRRREADTTRHRQEQGDHGDLGDHTASNAADLVLVAPGSIPITTSGKVRRGTCVEQYNGRASSPGWTLSPDLDVDHPAGDGARRQPGAVPHRPDGVDAEPAASHCGNSWRFLGGGFAMGTSVGLDRAVRAAARPAGVGGTSPLPRVQIVIGVLALARRRRAGQRRSAASLRRCRPPCRRWARTAGRTAAHCGWRRLAGLGIALPSVDYLAALAVILASGTSTDHADRGAGGVQRRGLRARRDPPRRLPGGTGSDPRDDGRPEQVASIATPPGCRSPLGRGRGRAGHGWTSPPVTLPAPDSQPWCAPAVAHHAQTDVTWRSKSAH